MVSVPHSSDFVAIRILEEISGVAHSVASRMPPGREVVREHPSSRRPIVLLTAPGNESGGARHPVIFSDGALDLRAQLSTNVESIEMCPFLDDFSVGNFQKHHQ